MNPKRQSSKSSPALKVLITGGAGFIGSHLADRLIADGHAVIALDDLSTGSRANLAALQGNPNFEFVFDDVRNESTLSVLVEKCDVIYHLAAAVGVRLIVERPVHTIETNIHGTEVVLRAANRFARPILIASTSEVYGKSERVPFHEDDDTVLGSTTFSRWSYACSKAIDEFLALAYARQYGLPVVIVRLFNTVGPRQTGQYGMVIPRFVESALRGEDLVIHGDGCQSRCFADVGDVVDCLVRLMNTPAAYGQVYNIGSTQEITINDLAARIIALTQSRGVLRRVSYEEAFGRPFDDMRRRVPSVERLQRTIGISPATQLEEILQKITAEKRSRLAAGQGS